MGDENPIRTLGDYSKPSHEGYRNTIELPIVVPLRSDTIRLVQNGCSFHRLWSEDPNQHLKDFLKLVDSLDLDGENREIKRLIAKLCNDILMSQQHHGESLSEAWTRFKDLLQKVPHHGIDLRLQVQILYDHVNPVTRRTIGQSASGKFSDQNAKESWALLEDLILNDNESWKDPRDFAKPVKAIALPQDVPSTSDRRLIKLKNQIQHLMEAYLAPTQPTQVNKLTTSCEICNGPHDTYKENEAEDGETMADITPEHGHNITKEARGEVKKVMEEDERLRTDSIPSSAYEENFSHERTYYYQSLLIGDEYMQDKEDKRGIRHLMRLEKEMMYDKGEVTLYLMRRSLEVLRKFQWTILGGRFNQLSHISYPLLSKLGEY
ncbi:hypothetical protein Tco_1053684 [Tanacetum coccineum]|uniref:MAK10-like protein n=1 Tax=Tanacetum coccineum TaxID=301880 RepID=A0ABQ5GWR6_9ASTR